MRDQKGKKLVEIPASAGAIGVVLAPWLTVSGVITALRANQKIVTELRE